MNYGSKSATFEKRPKANTPFMGSERGRERPRFWAGCAAQNPLAGCRRSGIAPAHAIQSFNRATSRRKEL